MNKLGVNVVFLGIFCLFAAFVRADDSIGALLSKVQNTNISPEDVVKDMKEKLNLSDDQAQKVLPVIRKQTAGMQELVAGLSSGDIDDSSIGKLQEVRDQANIELEQILTSEQMAKWRKLLAQGEARVHQMMEASGIGREE